MGFLSLCSGQLQTARLGPPLFFWYFLKSHWQVSILIIHKYHKWVSILSIHGQIKLLEGHSPLPQGGSRRLAPLLGFAAGGVPQISSYSMHDVYCMSHNRSYTYIYSLHVYMIIYVIICIYNTIISSMSIVITCSLTILNVIRNIIITTIKLICM